MDPDPQPAIAAEPSVQPARPRTNAFRNKFSTPRLSRDSARRQGAISHMAFSLLGGRDAAVAFLNAANDDLGGRPIDLAIASAEGFASVEAAIHAHIASHAPVSAGAAA